MIGAVRLVTGFGLNRTCETTRRSPAACRLVDGQCARRGWRLRAAADDARRIRDRRRRAAIVAGTDADTNRPATVGVAHLVLGVRLSLDLAAVLALGAAPQPDVRVRDRLVTGPLAAIGLKDVADGGSPRDGRLLRVRRSSRDDDPGRVRGGGVLPLAVPRDDLRADPEARVTLAKRIRVVGRVRDAPAVRGVRLPAAGATPEPAELVTDGLRPVPGSA